MDWNQITEFTGPLLKPLEPDGLLWHYTDTKGLEGIVQNRTIRLSHPSFLNISRSSKTKLFPWPP